MTAPGRYPARSTTRRPLDSDQYSRPDVVPKGCAAAYRKTHSPREGPPALREDVWLWYAREADSGLWRKAPANDSSLPRSHYHSWRPPKSPQFYDDVAFCTLTVSVPLGPVRASLNNKTTWRNWTDVTPQLWG
eukprot:gb/GECG01014227.1/.p1 GENE.gb/GECG01014227.1/~~gb/GECG01014227.1/.p1  ORF type:complete len:133 (+),score=8.09 gb/GECG01014227.1/:1-399(+)